MSHPEPSGPDLDGVVADANAVGLPYVVIGGFSVIANGFVCATKGSDLLVPDGQETDAAILRFLDRIEATRLRDDKVLGKDQIVDAHHPSMASCRSTRFSGSTTRAVNVSVMRKADNSVLGQILRNARHDLGVSQAQLAIRTGIAAPAISRIENGHESPSFERFSRCMEALGLTPTVELGLLGGSNADPTHLAAEAAMTPSQRLASLFEWMRFSDRLAQAQLRPLPERRA